MSTFLCSTTEWMICMNFFWINWQQHLHLQSQDAWHMAKRTAKSLMTSWPGLILSFQTLVFITVISDTFQKCLCKWYPILWLQTLRTLQMIVSVDNAHSQFCLRPVGGDSKIRYVGGRTMYLIRKEIVQRIRSAVIDLASKNYQTLKMINKCTQQLTCPL